MGSNGSLWYTSTTCPTSVVSAPSHVPLVDFSVCEPRRGVENEKVTDLLPSSFSSSPPSHKQRAINANEGKVIEGGVQAGHERCVREKE